MCELELVYGIRRRRRSGSTCRGSSRPTGKDRWTRYLRELVMEGARGALRRRSPDEIRERIEHELGVITSMGFAGYFLIVWDLIRFARENGIRVGPGPGLGRGFGRVVLRCGSPTSIRCGTT